MNKRQPVRRLGTLQIPARRFYFAVITAIAATLASNLHAAEKADLMEMSMDQLSQVEIKSDISSVRARTIREQPGIVTVVTEKEIHETGARDLTDVLLLVPGYSLDTDVESMVGLTFRGLMGQEGKVLLIVDGIEVNEPLYGSLPILNHIPADMIEQVEIIRGPGSAMYGGTAGLSVVRVTTKGANQNGGYGVVTPSYTNDRLSEQYAGGLGYTRGNWRFSANASYEDTFISNRRYTALNGAGVDLLRNSDMNPWLVDLGGGWRDLDLRFIYDAYRYDDSIDYGELASPPNATSFDSILTSAKYDVHAAEWLKITPQLTYRHQTPWEVQSPNGSYEIAADRYQADLSALADVTDNSGLLVGFRFQRDEATAIADSLYDVIPPSLYYGGHPSISYDDVAGYAQYDFDTPWVNVSVGGRYEHHDAVGGHFVPRIALTKAWDKFHVKALYSQASRTPGINVAQEAIGQLQAEQTKNYEIESGYRFTDTLSVVGNVFYMEVDEPIIFLSSPNPEDEGYFNGQKLSTYGFEGELRWNHPVVSSRLSYSTYRANDNDEPYVCGDDSRFLAAPSHKVTISETWHVMEDLDWNVNAFWITDRLAYEYPGTIQELPSEFVLNTFLEYRYRQFSFGVGVANLLDEDRYAPQPYAGGIAPLPLKGREVFAKLMYRF